MFLDIIVCFLLGVGIGIAVSRGLKKLLGMVKKAA
jgi:hypothetical protein